jgi:S-adenosylmethionine hydrolase
MPLLTLLTDFGAADYYVAAVKGTVLRLAPGTTLVDLGHEVAPGDVEAAAFLLAAAAPAFPPGTVHLAVVDPGVGSARAMVLLETSEALFLAPDNGLLTPFLERGRAFRVEREDLYLRGQGSTFHGRDRFAPVAAALLGGTPAAELGRPLRAPVRLERPAPRRDGPALVGQVIHVDRFGNLVTDLPSSWLGPGPIEAELDGHRVRHRASHYAELPAGEPGILPGSLGTLELAVANGDLARRWGVGRGAQVRILLQEGN